MDIGGSLFNSGFLGADFFWWIGQIADDSTWRDNIKAGKYTNRKDVPGWGRRYKVRIIGLHDKEEETVKSEMLPWAQIMYPVTAGGGQSGAFQTANLRQGMFVFGFFLDGKEQSVPVIMGVLGNNSQTKLEQDIGNSAANLSPTSGYSEGQVPKKGTSKETVPETDLVVDKPKSNSAADEAASMNNSSSGAQNQFGLPANKQVTDQQRADIKRAQEIGAKSIEDGGLGLEGEEYIEYIKKEVKKGMDNRVRNANAALSPSQPGATRETIDGVHLTPASDVIREDLYRKSIPVMKPDDIIGSAMKSMQIVIDNLTQDVDKYTSALADGGYIDAVSMNKNLLNLKATQSNAACEVSKYMKIIMDKMMEYVTKTLNKELSEKVAQMPSSQRWMMADMKEITGMQTLQNYNQITDNMCGTIEKVLEDSIGTSQVQDKFGGVIQRFINQTISEETGLDALSQEDKDIINAQNIAENFEESLDDEGLYDVSTMTNDYQQTLSDAYEIIEDNKLKKPKVPTCYAEELAAKIIVSNKKLIDKANDNVVKSINYFMNDMQKMLTESGATEDSGESISGQIMGITDEEVLDQVRGGTAYLTATSVPTGIYGNISPGITTSLGKGCIVNITVSSGGLSGQGSAQAENYAWIDRGSNYVNGNQGGVICDTSGIGTGMMINMTVATGEIQSVRVHTMGTGYKVGDEIYPHMQGGTGSIAGNGAFKLTMVAGPVDPGGIEIIKKGADYADGDVLFVNQDNYGVLSTDATFTTTSTSTKIKKQLSGTGQSLDDILGSLGDIGGNMTEALQFKNITSNVFPFELPPNEAVSDLYKLGTGGASKPDSQLPSVKGLADKIDTVKETIGEPGIPFIQPTIGEEALDYVAAKAKVAANQSS
tara:strand:- start:2486 stop:5128 length:2643 start_codon:yes stop_codon:yes gene_type:complete